jgi:hypothetical protein
VAIADPIQSGKLITVYNSKTKSIANCAAFIEFRKNWEKKHPKIKDVYDPNKQKTKLKAYKF